MTARAVVAWFAVTVSLLGFAQTSFAQDPTQDQEKLHALEQALAEEQARAEALAREARDQSTAMLELQRRSVTMAQNLQRAEADLATAQAALADTERQQQILQAEIDRYRGQMAHILPFVLRLNRRPSGIVSVAGADGVNDTVTQRRQTLALAAMSQSLQATMNEIRPLLTNARLLRQSLETERQIAAEKFFAARTAKQFVDLWLAQRNAALQKLRDQEAQSIDAQQALASEAENLRALLARIANSPAHVGAGIPADPTQIPDGIRPFPSQKDGLTLPAAGVIAIRFGEQIDTDRQGITLKTAAGALVTAPYDGRVVFSGQFRSYGAVLIIEHRGLYHSVLAGLDRVDVVPDQWVLAGEPIGSLPPGGKFGMLYFELRRNQKPIDPAPWLQAKLAGQP